MATINLFKKFVDIEKDGKLRTYTNFYIKCGEGKLIPIYIPYFGSEDKIDYQYSGRIEVLASFAAELPPLENEKNAKAETAIEDENLPF